MAENERNRSEGWRHAKLDGHENERLFGESLNSDQGFVSEIENFLANESPTGIPKVIVDGAKHVNSIFGDLTVSKVDLTVKWESGQHINISLKKSPSGQVWLVSVPRFLAALEFHLAEPIDPNVRAGISLFIGGSNLKNYLDLYNKSLKHNEAHNPTIADQERHQERLVAQSISYLFPSAWEAMIGFLNENIGLITKLSFAQGLASSEDDGANIIVYNNEKSAAAIFPILKLIEYSISDVKKQPISAGPRNGGSTLQLPTGFLQMHHPQGENQLQFHHQHKKISKLFSIS